MHAFLVYSPDNTNVAENIAINLKKAGVEIFHDTRRLTNRIDEYKSFSAHASAPIILIISDNFLKDKECMYESLNFLQNPALKNRIYPVVADGRKVDALNNVSYTTTKFERVSSVIHYMNYWQDQYLEMRKIKRDSQVKDEEKFNADLQIIRGISSEIGEFLRILRSSDYVDFELLHKNKFESFFRRSGWNNAYANFRDIGIVPFNKEVSKEVGVNLSSISGIDLIPNAAKDNNPPKVEIEVPPVKVEAPKVEVETIISKATFEEPKKEIETEGSPLLNKLFDYKNNIVEKTTNPILEKVSEKVTEVKEEIIPEAVVEVKTEIIEEIKKEIIPESEAIIEEVKSVDPLVKNEEAFEKEGLSYQDKSSYDLLVSLFEDDNEDVEEVKEELVEEVIQKESIINLIQDEVVEVKEEIIEEVKIDPVVEDIKEVIITHEEIDQLKNEIATSPVVYDIEAVRAVLEEGDTHEAVNMLKEVLSIQPENNEARYEYALLLSDKLKNYEESKKQLGVILSLDENNIEALLRLAELHELSEDNILAKHHYEKVLKLDYEYPGLHHKYASLLNNNFKAEKRNAIKHYKIAVQQDNNNIDALYQYAVMQYEFLGKPKKALKKFQMVIQKEPNHPFANYDIAVLFYEMGKPKLAAQYYRDAYQNNPELRTNKNDEAFKIDKYLFAPEEKIEEVKEAVVEDKIEAIEEKVVEEVIETEKIVEVTELIKDNTELTKEIVLEDKIEEVEKPEEVITTTTEEVLEEIYLDDVSDLTGTYKLTDIPVDAVVNELADTKVEETAAISLGDVIDSKEELVIEETKEEISIESENQKISYERIEELLEENDSFEDLEDEPEMDIQNEIIEELVEDVVDVVEESVLETINVPEIEEIVSPIEDLPSGKLGLATDFVTESIEEEIIPEQIIEEVIIEKEEEITIVEKKPTTIALITGATSGIGRASAHLFASKGHSLIITGRRSERLAATKQELEEKYGVSVETLVFDVRSMDACKKAMDSLDQRFKNVDILLNNAGLAKGKDPIHEGNIEHWETMIDTNIKGLLYMTRLVAPGMVARGKGHIINIGSIAGKEVYPNGNVYCATKHAVDALTKSMRIDLHKYNIRVSAVNPGAVEETEFSIVRHDFDASKAKDYQEFTPLNARDVADIVYFVATRPPHVNIQDVLVMGSQQATATISDNSGRK